MLFGAGQMLLRAWDKLPERLRIPEVRPYYEILRKKTFSLIFKRIFDVLASAVLLILLSPVFLILAIAIKTDSPGPVFYRQVRVTQYGKEFRIFKFRTMVANADRIGSQVTVSGDSRITRVGKVIRGCRLDEVCQLLNILTGDMSFVGTRPEVPQYVAAYTPEMLATLLLPAGVTSEASIRYQDEAELLDAAEDVDRTYIETVLPAKMAYNLQALQSFGFFSDIGLMFRTAAALLKRSGGTTPE